MATKKPVANKPAVKRTSDKPAITWAVPDVYVDDKRNTYVCVGTQLPERVPAYLTSRMGYVTVEYHGKAFPAIKPIPYDKPFKDAIKPYTEAGGNELDVSSLARQVLALIEANTDPARNDFIGPVVASNVASGKAASAAKPASKAKSGKQASSKPASLVGFVTLKQLLEEFKLDGKLVRGKLRAHYEKPVEGWVWLEKEADAIRADMRKWFKIQAAA